MGHDALGSPGSADEARTPPVSGPLNDDVAAMGPVKLAAVEAAQATLVKTAFSLAEQGRLTIVGPADKMM